MGEFLSVPIKDKESEEGENEMLRFCATGMQGWRKRMEDSHINDLSVGQSKTNLFGVFDGHGGKEVAIFVKKHFTEELLNNVNYQKNDIKTALIQNFLKMDEIMVDKNGKAELKKEAKKKRKRRTSSRTKVTKTPKWRCSDRWWTQKASLMQKLPCIQGALPMLLQFMRAKSIVLMLEIVDLC
jgi:hypothetical protein